MEFKDSVQQRAAALCPDPKVPADPAGDGAPQVQADQAPEAVAPVAYKKDTLSAVGVKHGSTAAPLRQSQPAEAQASLPKFQVGDLVMVGALNRGEQWFRSLLPILRILNESGVT